MFSQNLSIDPETIMKSLLFTLITIALLSTPAISQDIKDMDGMKEKGIKGMEDMKEKAMEGMEGYVIGQDSIEYSFSFDHMALSVKDVDSSVNFYKNVLGLKEITNRTEIEGIRWLKLSDGTELHLISIIKDNVTLNKAIHLGLTTPKFDSFVKRLDILKIDYSDWWGKPHTISVRADGIKQVYFQDLDGYWIDVNNAGQKK